MSKHAEEFKAAPMIARINLPGDQVAVAVHANIDHRLLSRPDVFDQKRLEWTPKQKLYYLNEIGRSQVECALEGIDKLDKKQLQRKCTGNSIVGTWGVTGKEGQYDPLRAYPHVLWNRIFYDKALPQDCSDHQEMLRMVGATFLVGGHSIQENFRIGSYCLSDGRMPTLYMVDVGQSRFSTKSGALKDISVLKVSSEGISKIHQPPTKMYDDKRSGALAAMNTPTADETVVWKPNQISSQEPNGG